MADGSSKQQSILLTTVPIKIGRKTTQIRLTVLENSMDNRTLIGNDFMEENKIMINTAQRAWCFSDNIRHWFNYTLTETMPNELPPLLQKESQREVLQIEPLLTTERTPTAAEIDSIFRKYSEVVTPPSPPQRRRKRKVTSDREIQQIMDEYKQKSLVPISPLPATPSSVKKTVRQLDCMSIQLTMAQQKEVDTPKTNMARIFADSGEATDLAIHYSKLKNNMPFITKTDAGSDAIRAVLIQGEDAEEHPSKYASRRLTPPDEIEPTIEKRRRGRPRK